MTDEELAKELLGAVPAPKEAPAPTLKWFWLYTKPPRERVDELHLMPIALLTRDKIGTPTFPVPEGNWPRCWNETRAVVLPKDMAHWWLFNVGGANVLNLVRLASGNDTQICPACMAYATEHPQEIAPP